MILSMCHTVMQATPGLDWNVAITHASEVPEMHGIVGQTWAFVHGDKDGELVFCHFD